MRQPREDNDKRLNLLGDEIDAGHWKLLFIKVWGLKTLKPLLKNVDFIVFVEMIYSKKNPKIRNTFHKNLISYKLFIYMDIFYKYMQTTHFNFKNINHQKKIPPLINKSHLLSFMTKLKFHIILNDFFLLIKKNQIITLSLNITKKKDISRKVTTRRLARNTIALIKYSRGIIN